MNWTALKDFLAVAEAGSLSRAARRLGVSQPTLSRRISALETELGAHLFTRSTRGLSPTTAGERLLTRVQRMQEEAVAIELETRGGGAPSGWVRVTASEGLAVEWLTARGVRFTTGGIRKGASGFDVCFIHPKGNDESPSGAAGVLVELVQAPEEVRDAFARVTG